jgi:hypothetical protein
VTGTLSARNRDFEIPGIRLDQSHYLSRRLQRASQAAEMGRKLERAELGHLSRSAASIAALTKTELMLADADRRRVALDQCDS